mgnify:CR=1 FL=1
MGRCPFVLERYYRELLNFCLRKVRDRDTAADLAQESYARVLGMQRAGKVIDQPAALLKQVALNAKIDLDRRAQLRQHEDIDALDETQQPASPQRLQPEAFASRPRLQRVLDRVALAVMRLGLWVAGKRY